MPLWRVLLGSLCCFGRWCNSVAPCLVLVLVVAPSSCIVSRVYSMLEAWSFLPLGHLVLANAEWSYRYRCGVAALPCLVPFSCVLDDWLLTRLDWVARQCRDGARPSRQSSLVATAFAVAFLSPSVNRSQLLSAFRLQLSEWQAWQTIMLGFCGAPDGRDLVVVLVTVVLQLVMRHPTPSYSVGRRLKALTDFPLFLFLSFLPFPLFSEGRGLPLVILQRWSLVARPAACAEREWRRGSEEEAAVHREDPWLGSVLPKSLGMLVPFLDVVWGTPGCSIPAVGLPADVAAVKRIATSEKASPRSVLSGCRVLTPDCCFDNPFLGAIRGGTGRCSSLTSWSVRGAGWFCLWVLDLVKV
ncbi:hypothetical protein Taro_011714 [Colocasia esculenta]|uniref:Uncharacterized protein n=1 Tax=Colocasia esculenta TaxID=4460 RepID=A0A843U6Z0_COLES|nr:hypothetical protein [Colocasia esculenta]